MKKLNIFTVLSLVSICLGCETFLAEKTDKTLVVPASLNDLQSLLDNQSVINNNDPGNGELAADDFYLPYDIWAAISESDQRAYVWEPDYTTVQSIGWYQTYRVVYWANITFGALQNIERIPSNQSEWDDVKGQAHFLRAKSFLQLAGIWAPAYDKSTATMDLGIPLRLTDDFNKSSVRSSLQDTYLQVISDLEVAVDLLPVTPLHVLRPSKPAALALLARTFLFMGEYEKCLDYADACLRLRDELMDYNELNPIDRYPVPKFNKEVLYHSQMSNPSNPAISLNSALVDSSLYDSYMPYDLRKELFFRNNANGTYNIRGNYTGSSLRFGGVATDEVYLMRAECRVRLNDLDGALDDLNKLLVNRYSNAVAFSPIEVQSQEELLQHILWERRKQLLMRGLRFPDVKRLNMDGREIGFKRILDGVEYVLPPNDPRFAVAIPEEVIELAPGVLPNPR